MAAAERAECPECGTEQALKTDGTFRKHGAAPGCPGSGQLPAVADDFEDFDDEPAPVEELAPGSGFEWSLTVASPSPYLDDVEWHLANGRMAERRAIEAGHTVTGEAAYDRLSESGNRLTLYYRVPVR